jgi:hypothetical protein
MPSVSVLPCRRSATSSTRSRQLAWSHPASHECIMRSVSMPHLACLVMPERCACMRMHVGLPGGRACGGMCFVRSSASTCESLSSLMKVSAQVWLVWMVTCI